MSERVKVNRLAKRKRKKKKKKKKKERGRMKDINQPGPVLIVRKRRRETV
jgi:hypothetical protein